MVCDVGFMGESDCFEDVYRFKMLMLCNVELIVFYGYNGVYLIFEGIVWYYFDLDVMFVKWILGVVVLFLVFWLEVIDFVVWNDICEMVCQVFFWDVIFLFFFDYEILDLVVFLKVLIGIWLVYQLLFGILDSVLSGLLVDWQFGSFLLRFLVF